MAIVRRRRVLRRLLIVCLTIVAVSSAGAVSTASASTAGLQAISDRYIALGGAAGVLGPSTTSASCDTPTTPGGCGQSFGNGWLVWSPAAGVHHTLQGPIHQRWVFGSGGAGGPLGYPTTDPFCGLAAGGCGQHFQRGSVYSGGDGVARIVGQDVRDVWARAGWERGPLGYPTSESDCSLQSSGCLQRFEGGVVYRTSSTGTHAVHSAFLTAYAAVGWERGLGFPTTDRFCGLPDGGCGQHFEWGSLYSSRSTPASVVRAGVFLDRWSAAGWENGAWGYPTTDRFCGLAAGACGQHFQGGSLYGVQIAEGLFGGFVSGSIRDYWSQRGWERGWLGGPRADAFCGLRDGGCGQHFQGGSVYWSPSTGAHGISGAIRDRWAQQGWERGALGLPTSEVFCGLRDGGCGQHFQGGSIYDSANTPPVVLFTGPVRDRWASTGWETGRYGYPVGEQYTVRGGWAQSFQGGTITWAYGRVR